jgi:transcriptional regulator with XRE-family HTH domain
MALEQAGCEFNEDELIQCVSVIGIDMTAGEKLKKWMERQRFSQTEAGERFGVDQSQVSRWVNGTAVPRFSKMLEIQTGTDGFVALADWAADVTPRKQELADC